MTMDTKEALAHAEASYTELCAAMRAPDELWEVTERRPQLRRMRAVVDHFAALAGEVERLKAELEAGAVLGGKMLGANAELVERAKAAEARAEGLAKALAEAVHAFRGAQHKLHEGNTIASAQVMADGENDAIAALNPPRGGGEEG